MSLRSRPITHFEWDTMTFNSETEMAIEIDNPRLIPEFIDKIHKMIISFHIFSDGKRLIEKVNVEDTLKLPETKDLVEASDWTFENMYPYSKSLATLAANDHQIVFCINHLGGDGGFLQYIVKSLQDPNYIPSKLPVFPEPIEVAFEKQFRDVDPNFEYLNRLQWTRSKSSGPLPPEDQARVTRHSFFRDSVTNFKAYNHNTKKCSGFTECIWNALTLSMCALNGKLGPIGCLTCADLRSTIKAGIQNQNAFGILGPTAPVSPYQTVEELGKLMRRDFEMRKARGDQFMFFHPTNSITHNGDCPGAHAEISLMNPLRVHSPIVDAYAQVVTRDKRNKVVSLLGQSVINEDKGTNLFVGRLRTPQSQINDRDAHLISKGIHYFLTHIDKDTLVGDAFEQIVAYQKSL